MCRDSRSRRTDGGLRSCGKSCANPEIGDEAVREAVRVGTYPGAWELRGDWARWRAYVRDAIIEPAIGRDVLAMGQVRRPALLRQVFAVAAGSPAEILSLQKMQGQLADRGALETIAHYLKLLREAYFVAGLEKFSGRVSRRRAARVENACLASAVNAGQRVTYWREEPLEIDGVIQGSWGPWAVEIKTGRFASTDLRGLLEFTRRHPKFQPLVITGPGDEERARQLGLHATSWVDFLRSGVPPAGGTAGSRARP